MESAPFLLYSREAVRRIARLLVAGSFTAKNKPTLKCICYTMHV